MKLPATVLGVLVVACITQTHAHNLHHVSEFQQEEEREGNLVSPTEDTYSFGQFQQEEDSDLASPTENTYSFGQFQQEEDRNSPPDDTYSFKISQFQQEDEFETDSDGFTQQDVDGDEDEQFAEGEQVDDGVDDVFNDAGLQLFNVPPVDDEDGPYYGEEQDMTPEFRPPFRLGKRQVEGEPISLQQQDEGRAVAQWNNRYHQPLKVECGTGFGLYLMRSAFNRAARDRVFLFQCKRIAPTTACVRGYDPNKRVCRWTRANTVGINGNFQCPANYYMAGVQSAATCKHDREWNILCCVTPHICHNTCAWTGYVNGYGNPINFATGGVFAGMISVYHAGVGDRAYRLKHCTLKMC